ncbi:SAF domain-containing protein [Spirillospora sp. NPDC052269]
MPQTVRIAVAARDLAAGATLRPGDIRITALPPAVRPDGAVRNPPVGRVLAGAVRKGEALTDARFLGPGLLDEQPPGTVATPIRVADSAAVRLLHPGDRVDVLAATPPGTASDPPPVPDIPAPTPSPDETRTPRAGKPAVAATAKPDVDTLVGPEREPTQPFFRTVRGVPEGGPARLLERGPWVGERTTAGQRVGLRSLGGGGRRSGLVDWSRVVVASVLVLAVPREESGLGGAGQGALVVLATSRMQAAALAGAGGPLVVVLVKD